MTQHKRQKIGIWLTLNTTFLWDVAEGVIRYAHEHTDWRVFGKGLGITEPLDPRQKLDGVIFNMDRSKLDLARLHRKAPCVKVGTEPKPWDFPLVFQDHWTIGRMGAEHLVSLGLPRLAFCGAQGRSFSAFRAEGFVESAEKHALPFEIFEYALHYNPNATQWCASIRVLTEWLKQLPTPCGIMACSDLCAAQVSLVAESIGLRIPEDIALVGVNNDKVTCSLTTPRLSSIAFDGVEMGYQAAALLDASLSERPYPSPVIIPPGKLHIRESTNYIPVEHPMVRKALMKIQSEGIRNTLQVGDLLEGTGLSRRVFERQFRNIVGRSPKEEILRARLEQAQNRLREPGAKISGVAEAMGFSSPQEFSRFIKNYTGLSPSAYQKKHRH